MKNFVKIVAAAVVAVAIAQTVQAVPLPPITGNIAFSGAATLNTSSVNTATEVVSWGVNTVTSDSGTFPTALIGTTVTLFSPWKFNSGPQNNFWSVTGFTFNLSSSSIFYQGNGLLYVIIAGTVSGAGYAATAFSGAITIQNPPGKGATFSESLSFNSVPDGGTTVLLLGSALSGLALIKRKFKA
jgi:hypothetical protein